MLLPVSVEPVKDTLSTFMLFTSSAPTDSPGPVIALMTPGGMPSTLLMSLTNSIEIPEVYPAGLITTVQPEASAGPSFQERSDIGEFHGTISAQTPTGSWTTRLTSVSLYRGTLPTMCLAADA